MSQLNTNKISNGNLPTALGVLGEANVNGLVNQSWQNVTATRVTNTTYTNTTGRSIMVVIFRNTVAASSDLVVNGIIVGGHRGTVSYQSTITAIVPNGGTYSYNQAFNTWWELR